jgi:tRNA-dihydrouridine synthase
MMQEQGTRTSIRNKDNNKNTTQKKRELHIAPMLDISTPEFLHLFRILSKRAILWTEMVVDSTILHTRYLDHHLAYSPELSPIVCQIGGRHEKSCGDAARIVQGYGYDEVNLNIDCPSNRVSCADGGGCGFGGAAAGAAGGRTSGAGAALGEQGDRVGREQAGSVQNQNDHHDMEGERTHSCSVDNSNVDGGFGAILMYDAEAAVSAVQGIKDGVNNMIPVSVKTRVGIELTELLVEEESKSGTVILDTLEHLIGFVGKLRDSCGCKRFVIHARKCVVGGLLTPAQNRIVPPLNYPRVYELCRYFPDCEFILNGGIPGLVKAKEICYGTEQKHVAESGGAGNGDGGGVLLHEKDGLDDRFVVGSTNDLHGVPCSSCNATNGSCTISPFRPPDNLVGCMLGRACMENPAMFWDVDRYFYGEESNPCRNRRDVLEKYCRYLETTYPRRCCDNDHRKTSRLPAPQVVMFTSGGCPICKEFYGEDEGQSSGNNSSPNIMLQRDSTSTVIHNKDQVIEMYNSDYPREKITSRAIGRCLKPVRGLFFGLRGGKRFRLECDRLNRDSRVRNCGPGYILRKIMSELPKELLDTPFVKTEDLGEGDVSVHVAPVSFRVENIKL